MAVAFRLGRVLRLRETLRRTRQDDVARLVVRRAGVEGERRRVVSERARVLEGEAEAAAHMVLDPAFLSLSRQFEAALAATESHLAEAAAELDRLVARGREELIGERREERKLLTLAERHRARLELEERWRADRELDELALARHRRESAQEGKRGPDGSI
ncbi:MAG TPA: hypothetical protein VFD92_25550 [Candidatus Binatia bacterium]|nr:hypothetical protein [Candidatus Binatia bacterium]